MRRAILLLPMVLFGCGHDDQKPVVVPEYHYVYPTFDEGWLSCLPETKVTPDMFDPKSGNDLNAVHLTEAFRNEAADCREKLSKVRDYVHSWPKDK